MKRLSLLVIVVLSASVASAAVLEDFDGAYTGPGALVTDPADPTNTVLHLAEVDGTNNAEVYQIAVPDTAGVFSVRIYDFGANDEKVDSRYGPRWGFTGNGALPATVMTLMYKSWLSGYKGYVANENTGTVMTSPTDPIYSVYWAIGTVGRYVKALDDLATPDVDEAQGAWSTWTFEVATDGTITVTAEAEDLVDPNGGYQSGPVSHSGDLRPVGTIETFFVSAGTNDAEPVGYLKFVGLLIDDVSFTAAGPVCNPGDADGDGDVDLDDFATLKRNFGTSEGADCSMGDFDGDGDVDLDDFALLKTNFGT